LFFICHLPISFSQNCEYEIKEIDKFEKVEKVLTKKVKVMYPSFKPPVVFLALGRVDSDYILQLEFSYNKYVCLNSESNELLLMTENNEVIRLKRESDEIDCLKNNGMINVGTFNYNIERNVLEKLSDKTLTALRIYHSDGYIDVDLTKKNVNAKKAKEFLKTQIPCILN